MYSTVYINYIQYSVLSTLYDLENVVADLKQSCKRGYYKISIEEGLTFICELCPSGSFCSENLRNICPAGTYNPTNGTALLTDCLNCPKGYFCLVVDTG